MSTHPTIDQVLSAPLDVPFMHIKEGGREVPSFIEMSSLYQAAMTNTLGIVQQRIGPSGVEHGTAIEHRFQLGSRSAILRTTRTSAYGQRITSLDCPAPGGGRFVFSIEIDGQLPFASFEAVTTGMDEGRSTAIAMIAALRCLILGALASPPGSGDVFELLDMPSDAGSLVAAGTNDMLPIRYDAPTPWSPLCVRRHSGEELLTPAQKRAWASPPLIDCSLKEDSNRVSFSASSGVVFSEDSDPMEMLRIAERLPRIEDDSSC